MRNVIWLTLTAATIVSSAEAEQISLQRSKLKQPVAGCQTCRSGYDVASARGSVDCGPPLNVPGGCGLQGAECAGALWANYCSERKPCWQPGMQSSRMCGCGHRPLLSPCLTTPCFGCTKCRRGQASCDQCRSATCDSCASSGAHQGSQTLHAPLPTAVPTNNASSNSSSLDPAPADTSHENDRLQRRDTNRMPPSPMPPSNPISPSDLPEAEAPRDAPSARRIPFPFGRTTQTPGTRFPF